MEGTLAVRGSFCGPPTLLVLGGVLLSAVSISAGRHERAVHIQCQLRTLVTELALDIVYRQRYSAADMTIAVPGATLGERILTARMVLSADEHAKVSQEALGARVAQHLNDPRPITGATVSRWETGESVPDLEILGAIGVVCRVDPGWLAFGSETRAPDPRDIMARSGTIGAARATNTRTMLNQEQIERLLAEAEAHEKAFKARVEELENAKRAIQQIEDGTEREARMNEFRARVTRFFAADKAQNAERRQRLDAAIARHFRLSRQLNEVAKSLFAEADAQRAREAAPNSANA